MDKLQSAGFWNALAVMAEGLGQVTLPGSAGTYVHMGAVVLSAVALAFARGPVATTNVVAARLQ